MILKELRQVMESNNFEFKKMFGQNFIIDDNVINNIILKSEILENSLVIEIGPGAGSLTQKLSANADHVLCYEIDNKLKDLLSITMKDNKNVDIIYQDFLKSNIKEDIKKYKYEHLYIIANLPYYITTPIINKIIEDKIDVEKIVIMVQKEVGNRFKAVPGNKDYSSLSIYLNYYFEIKKVMDVSKNVFMPKPNVDSIVIELKKRNNLLLLNNEDIFFKLLRDAFKQKRKTLKNNLKEYDLEKIESILKKYNYNLNVRAEQLKIEIFVEIANSLS